MSPHPASRRSIVVACALVFSFACAEEGSLEAGDGRVAAALDNQADPDDGKTCYQDVPMRKGKMEMGMCCFDDPDKGTSECVKCDGEHHCTVGGAEPGALVRGDLGEVLGGVTGVLEPLTPTPPPRYPTGRSIGALAR